MMGLCGSGKGRKQRTKPVGRLGKSEEQKCGMGAGGGMKQIQVYPSDLALGKEEVREVGRVSNPMPPAAWTRLDQAIPPWGKSV